MVYANNSAFLPIAQQSHPLTPFCAEYGNTIGCSVPLMLADPVHRSEGEGLMVAFGLSFSCGACTMTVPQGGWTP